MLGRKTKLTMGNHGRSLRLVAKTAGNGQERRKEIPKYRGRPIRNNQKGMGEGRRRFGIPRKPEIGANTVGGIMARIKNRVWPIGRKKGPIGRAPPANVEEVSNTISGNPRCSLTGMAGATGLSAPAAQREVSVHIKISPPDRRNPQLPPSKKNDRQRRKTGDFDC